MPLSQWALSCSFIPSLQLTSTLLWQAKYLDDWKSSYGFLPIATVHSLPQALFAWAFLLLAIQGLLNDLFRSFPTPNPCNLPFCGRSAGHSSCGHTQGHLPTPECLKRSSTTVTYSSLIPSLISAYPSLFTPGWLLGTSTRKLLSKWHISYEHCMYHYNLKQVWLSQMKGNELLIGEKPLPIHYFVLQSTRSNIDCRFSKDVAQLLCDKMTKEKCNMERIFLASQFQVGIVKPINSLHTPHTVMISKNTGVSGQSLR